ncbi:hypothetical protein Val02_14970 [Virgisporangium aliadipatigenens]|uniref:Uncharacterized protein n=1 Tax=Virgisporangium aliadipatigenens TaxID=741659 RepID=A0A8J3YGG8_9ACTN|nr:hypothetical protein Val02_14970 [Virgisporangium aliadipatigenens]
MNGAIPADEAPDDRYGEVRGDEGRADPPAARGRAEVPGLAHPPRMDESGGRRPVHHYPQGPGGERWTTEVRYTPVAPAPPAAPPAPPQQQADPDRSVPPAPADTDWVAQSWATTTPPSTVRPDATPTGPEIFEQEQPSRDAYTPDPPFGAERFGSSPAALPPHDDPHGNGRRGERLSGDRLYSRGRNRRPAGESEPAVRPMPEGGFDGFAPRRAANGTNGTGPDLLVPVAPPVAPEPARPADDIVPEPALPSNAWVDSWSEGSWSESAWRASAALPPEPPEPPSPEPAEPVAAVLPRRTPSEPDVPVVPGEEILAGDGGPAETPALERISTFLRDDRDEEEAEHDRPDGFHFPSVVDAVKVVPGVRDAAIRTNEAGVPTLRLELADDADPAQISREVARLLKEQMGLAAEPSTAAPVAPAPEPVEDEDAAWAPQGDPEDERPSATVTPLPVPPLLRPDPPREPASVVGADDPVERREDEPYPFAARVLRDDLSRPTGDTDEAAPEEPARDTGTREPFGAGPVDADADGPIAGRRPEREPAEESDAAGMAPVAGAGPEHDDEPEAGRGANPHVYRVGGVPATPPPFTEQSYAEPGAGEPPFAEPRPSESSFVEPGYRTSAFSEPGFGEPGRGGGLNGAGHAPGLNGSAGPAPVDYDGSIAFDDSVRDTVPPQRTDPDDARREPGDSGTAPKPELDLSRFADLPKVGEAPRPADAVRFGSVPRPATPRDGKGRRPRDRRFEAERPPQKPRVAVESPGPQPLPTPASLPRVRLVNFSAETRGLDASVTVKLEADGVTAEGTVAGPAVDGYILRLCAAATARALDDLLVDSASGLPEGRCFVEHTAVVPFGGVEVGVVVVLLVCGGWVEQLSGSAIVTGDGRQAVIRATLDAVNRRLEALLS